MHFYFAHVCIVYLCLHNNRFLRQLALLYYIMKIGGKTSYFSIDFHIQKIFVYMFALFALFQTKLETL
jgi:hypothetical protein